MKRVLVQTPVAPAAAGWERQRATKRGRPPRRGKEREIVGGQPGSPKVATGRSGTLSVSSLEGKRPASESRGATESVRRWKAYAALYLRAGSDLLGQKLPPPTEGLGDPSGWKVEKSRQEGGKKGTRLEGLLSGACPSDRRQKTTGAVVRPRGPRRLNHGAGGQGTWASPGLGTFVALRASLLQRRTIMRNSFSSRAGAAGLKLGPRHQKPAPQSELKTVEATGRDPDCAPTVFTAAGTVAT